MNEESLESSTMSLIPFPTSLSPNNGVAYKDEEPV